MIIFAFSEQPVSLITLHIHHCGDRKDAAGIQKSKHILGITQALFDNTTELHAVHVTIIVTHLNHICSIVTTFLTQVAYRFFSFEICPH